MSLRRRDDRPTQPLNGRRIKAFVPFSNLDDNKLSKEAGTAVPARCNVDLAKTAFLGADGVGG
jgi:hypothetical protein